MKNCELCKSPAQTYCESDQAILCWDCDAKVHGANFLVSRHCRSLLCKDCKSPTPWKASGARLGHTVSVCDGCAAVGRGRSEDGSERSNDDDPETDADEDEFDDDEADEYDEYEDEEEEEEDREEDGENQVVPGSSTPPPPAASSSSSEDDFSETSTVFSRKRSRENAPDLHSLDDLHRSSSAADKQVSFADSYRLAKSQRAEPGPRSERTGSASATRTAASR